MESEDIIERVTKPTDWCAGMVPVQKKNGDIRIRVDLKNLNKSVRREHYPLQRLEDIFPQLSGSTVFTSLDAASGFWQVPLNQRNRELTTFITPFGRFMFKRLRFGINSATEIFQRKMMDLFHDEPGVEVIVDDILVHGRDQSEHDALLQRTLGIMEKAGVVLNMAKCKFNKHELEYYGHVVGRDGVKPSPNKIKAILELKPPENITELRSIDGMFQFLGKFVPHFSTVMKPVTELLKSDRAWVWGSVQQAAFDAAKELRAQSRQQEDRHECRHEFIWTWCCVATGKWRKSQACRLCFENTYQHQEEIRPNRKGMPSRDLGLSEVLMVFGRSGKLPVRDWPQASCAVYKHLAPGWDTS